MVFGIFTGVVRGRIVAFVGFGNAGDDGSTIILGCDIIVGKFVKVDCTGILIVGRIDIIFGVGLLEPIPGDELTIG
jgi:hypothetical protein